MMQFTSKLRHCMTFLLPVLVVLSASAQTDRMMPWKEYSRHSYRWPYLLNIYMSHGGLFYFGANHSKDPLDEQFAEIEALWKQFQPEFVLDASIWATDDQVSGNSVRPADLRWLLPRGSPGFELFGNRCRRKAGFRILVDSVVPTA
jgi:hypothetical protein